MAWKDERTGNEVIPLAQCVHRLEAKQVARVAFNRDGRIHLYPVNYVWDGEAIVFRCESGSPLADTSGTEIVIEVDDIDDRAQEGWSVIARGVPEVVDPEQSPDTMRRLKSLALYPWAARDSKDLWLRTIPAPLSGRVVKRAERS